LYQGQAEEIAEGWGIGSGMVESAGKQYKARFYRSGDALEPHRGRRFASIEKGDLEQTL
jgi:hypothetical protein